MNMPLEPSRRLFFKRSLLTAAAVVPAGVLSGYAVWFAPQQLAVRQYRLRIPDLPDFLNGLRLAQLSDTHYGPLVSLAYLESVITRTNLLRPDVVLLTGDYVHRTANAITDGIGLFQELKSRHGVVGVLGNHDHWEGAEACRARFNELGIPLLDNKRCFLTEQGIVMDMPAVPALCIAGVGDLMEDAVEFESALGGLPESMPRILLSHNPDVAEDSRGAEYRIDFMCSGHTHGGQIWVPGLGTPVVPSAYGQKYAGGLCTGPHFPVVVSRGVGMTIVPVRFGVLPEIVMITLVRN